MHSEHQKTSECESGVITTVPYVRFLIYRVFKTAETYHQTPRQRIVASAVREQIIKVSMSLLDSRH